MNNQLLLARFARRLRIGTLTVAIALAAVILVATFAPRIGTVRFNAAALPYGWGLALAWVVVALVVTALIELARMLRQIELGEPFAPATTRHFRGFARLLLAAAIARVVLPPIAEIAVIAQQAGGVAHLGLDDSDALLLLLSGVLFLVARLFDEAARLKADSESII